MIENWLCSQESWAVWFGWVSRWINELTMLNFTWALWIQITVQLRYPPNFCFPESHHLFLFQEKTYCKEPPSPNDLDKTGCLLFLVTLIRFADNCFVYPVTAIDLSPFAWTCWKARGRPSTSYFLSHKWLAEE